MFWHHHHHGGQASADLTPSLPPPTEGGEDLNFLDPAETQLRVEAGRLQMWLEGPEEKEVPPAEDEAVATEEPTVGEETLSAEEPPAAEESPAPEEPPAPEESPAPEEPPAPEPLVFAWREVSLVRLFPLSDPERWVAVITAEGREVGILADVAELPPDARDAVRDDLHRRYMVPEIRRIVSCRDRYDLAEWTVETNRGQVTFLTRHVREQVKRPFPSRLVLLDVEGNRYDVPDVDALDPDSRRILDERT